MHNANPIQFKEIQLSKIYRTIHDCHQISDKIYCIVNQGVYEIKYQVDNDLITIEDKQLYAFNEFLVKYINDDFIVSKNKDKVVYRASQNDVAFFITIDSNGIVSHKSYLTQTAINYYNANS